MTEVSQLTVGVLGGTGPQGKGMAMRWSQAGLKVVLGSRASERAETTAAEVAEAIGTGAVTGADNASCASQSDVVLVAVPYAGPASVLESLGAPLAGKIVIDCVNPLGFDSRGPYALDVEAGSAAQEAAVLLPDSRVTAAFHHVSSVHLIDVTVTEVDTDVLVLGDDREATDVVRALADLVPGMRGIFAGRLRNAGQVEALTANLIAMNRRYKAHAGIRITDVDP
ncbi:MAG: NADPH-dependent F420 reductase [Sciscionella sp.]